MMIHTDRLILRAFREEDAGDLLEYLSCPKVNCFMDMRLCSLEQARLGAQKRSQDDEYCFAIVLKETGKVIGEIEAHPEGDDKDTFSPCWMLNEAYQRKGYAFEAAGENIAHHRDVDKAQAAFLSSPGHRRNVLSSRYTRAGIGIALDGGSIYLTQIFCR